MPVINARCIECDLKAFIEPSRQGTAALGSGQSADGSECGFRIGGGGPAPRETGRRPLDRAAGHLGGTVRAVSAPSVAVDVGSLLGPRTGVGQFVARLLDGLAMLHEPPEVRPYVLSFRAQLPVGVRRLRFPAGPALRCWGRTDHPSADRTFTGADVVHGPNYVVPPSRLPTVVSVHDCWFLQHPEEVPPAVRSFGPALRRAARRGVTVHVPSEHTAGQVRDLLGAEHVAVVPLGAPTVLPPSVPVHLAGLEGRSYVLALGAKEPRKNLPRLIDAFGLLAEEVPDLALVLLGPDGPDAPAIDAAVARQPRDATDRILLVDYVPDDARNAILHGASALAYPSLDEGFGFSALEAMAAGVPVVAADAGSLPEVCGDAALLVDPVDAPAMASALARVVTDDELRATLIRRGHDRVESFSVPRSAARMDALYRALAEGGR
jgi:glycosyltransferase involved in cell wall biosynthesis